VKFFYDFGRELKIHEQSPFRIKKCHPSCNCGRFLEIGNSVFMQYIKTENGFKELPGKNVDFGGGLERILAALENKPDIFTSSSFSTIIEEIQKITQKSYQDKRFTQDMRIIADHLRRLFFSFQTISILRVKPKVIFYEGYCAGQELKCTICVEA